MGPAWFRPRGYKHLDSQVGARFAAKVVSPTLVAQHSWSPLISYDKQQKRYKSLERKTVMKSRQIMYASHRDACILSYYAAQLTDLLDQQYQEVGLNDVVIAYRTLGKSNYDFTADALAFAQAHSPCVLLCFDVTGFFDNLDHRVLKSALTGVLGGTSLPPDWYAVLKAVSKFRHIPLAALKSHPTFAANIKRRSRTPIATIAEVKASGIVIEGNSNGYGIPQGTPISAALSNLYMWELDVVMAAACLQNGAFYQRYSDDILLAVPSDVEASLADLLVQTLAGLKLKLNAEKTERIIFDLSLPETIQYLGFNISPGGTVIRPGSLSRQWRKARRSIRQTQKVGEAAIAAGTATKIFTKKLRRRFLLTGPRNFSSYARRSAKALGSKKILKQVRRLERMVERTLDDLP